jgi:hypothetical protein
MIGYIGVLDLGSIRLKYRKCGADGCASYRAIVGIRLRVVRISSLTFRRARGTDTCSEQFPIMKSLDDRINIGCRACGERKIAMEIRTVPDPETV